MYNTNLAYSGKGSIFTTGVLTGIIDYVKSETFNCNLYNNTQYQTISGTLVGNSTSPWDADNESVFVTFKDIPGLTLTVKNTSSSTRTVKITDKNDNILNTTSLASNKTATIVVRDYTSDVIYDLTTQSSGSIIIVKETTGTLTSNNTITVTTD